MTIRTLLLVLLLTLPARAEVAVDLQAELPLGEHARVQRPLPASCVLTNRGEATRVRLELVPDPEGGVWGGAIHERGVAEVDLPAGARQRVDLLMPRYDGSGEVQVRLLVGRTQLAVRLLPVNPVYEDNRRMVAVLSPEPASFAYLAAYKTPASGDVTLVRPNPERFPETATALAGLDTVVLHDLPALGLSPAAQQALADWCRTAGTLLLVSAGDPQEFRGTPLDSLLPLRPGATATAGGLPVLTGALARAEVLDTLDGSPLLVAGPRVGGVAALLTTPLPSSDLLGSARTEGLWKRLTAREDSWRGVFPSLTPGEPLLASAPELQPPDLGLVVWFLLGYVVLVGPVNFMVLRRQDRMLRVFLTVPLLAGGFAFLAFTGGYMVRGGQLLLLESGQLGLRSGEASARWQGAVALYSPRPDRYAMSLPVGSRLLEDRSGPDSRPLELTLDRRVELREVEMRMWSMRRFRSAGPVLLEGPVELRDGGARWVAENRSNLTLEGCRVVRKSSMSAEFDLPPGARHEVAELPEPAVATLGGERQRVWDAFVNRSGGREETYLTGWTERSLAGWRVEGERAELRAETLVVVGPP